MNTAIHLGGVSKTLGGRQVLQDVAFDVERGDIFGYLGRNGAGKTTTIRILLDLLRPSAGEALVLGERVDRPETRRRLGFVLDADGLYGALSARENLVFYARLYGVASDSARLDELARLVGLQGRVDEPVGGFSKGMRQRLAIARALVHDPEVLILDEPMSGVDPSGRIALREILLGLVRAQGKTVLLSSHDLGEVQRTCNRIALIDRGRIRACGELRSLMRERGEGEVEVELAAVPAAAALAALEEAGPLGFRGASGVRLLFEPGDGLGTPDVVRAVVERGLRVEGVRRREPSLEELWSSLIEPEAAA